MAEGGGEQRETKSRRKRSRSSKSKKHDDDDHVETDASAAVAEKVGDGATHEKGITTSDKEQVSDKLEGDEGEDQGVEKPKRKRKRKRKTKSTEASETPSQDEHDPNNVKLSSLDLTVYVEGIPFDCSEEDVKTFFVSNGCADILQLRLPRWQDSGRLRGYGHVVFDSETSRSKAVGELNGMNLGQRYLTIQVPKAPRPDTSMGAMESRTVRDQPAGCKTVFVKNLPYDASEDDIREAFQVTGKILDDGVRIARNSRTHQSKGFAYVEYKNPEGAQGAVQKAAKPFGMTVKGRPAFVDYEEGSQKASFKKFRP